MKFWGGWKDLKGFKLLILFNELSLPKFTIFHLCLPLFTFVYLCLTDASMHKFCACLKMSYSCATPEVHLTDAPSGGPSATLGVYK